jgi:hypothetical protein
VVPRLRWLRSGAEDAFERRCDRAGSTRRQRRELTRSPAYRSGGEWMMPWPMFATLAEALARAEPDTVTRYVHDEQRRYAQRG